MMASNIRIDVSRTDKRILKVLHKLLGNQPGEVRLRIIAEKAPCSIGTAFKSTKRLQSAGYLKIEFQGTPKPCVYQVLTTPIKDE